MTDEESGSLTRFAYSMAFIISGCTPELLSFAKNRMITAFCVALLQK